MQAAHPRWIGLPPQHHSLCPSTGGSCPHLARPKRPCWEQVQDGSSLGCHPRKKWNFRCKLLLSGTLSARKLTPAKMKNTTHIHSKMYYMDPAWGNINKCSAVAETGGRLATIDMGRKLGAVPLLGELGPHLTQCGLGQGLPPYQVASW